MTGPRTLDEVTALPDETTLRRILAMLSTGGPESGDVDDAAA